MLLRLPPPCFTVQIIIIADDIVAQVQVSVATSQLQGLWFNPGKSVEFPMFSSCPSEFLLGFQVTSKIMPVGGLATLN